MRRSIAYCRYHALWWSQQTQRLSTVNSHLAEGLVAYAAEQMSFENRRAELWQTRWLGIRERALLVRQTQLGEEENSPLMPEMEVELEEEEVNDWDADDDDGEDG